MNAPEVAAPEPTPIVEARLSRNRWVCEAPGGDGYGLWRHKARGLALIHSAGREADGALWEHVSVSRRDGQMPTWAQLSNVFHEVCGPDALGVIVIPPRSEHVDIAEVAHAWCCRSHRPLPDFTRGTGSI